MIWLLSKLFEQVAPLFHFIGDHRYGSFALLLFVAALAAWACLPVIGAQTAKILGVLALCFLVFDWGYSYRAAIDRETWKQAEARRLAAELAEHARREAALAKAKTDAVAAARAEAALEADRAKILMETDNASRENDRRACLPAAGVMRLNRIR